ncbi:hypothetical protein ASE74_10035 [Pedobacter sp. Leaf216]|uniref:hypothetical protein n=1 Tax=Pedobacter sp. Leaf216 TaxID=1735684 RepID=UPI0006F94476|nr:hypothetical protein [Pedobacter sp. Leaf216]KQM65201.1 hypothetical protein ASE74_10035 [Pedobacter sp. Leaf216]RZJ74842.1 MAG: hypothetical protein EOO45_07425 [Flavobacterium sp.]
MLKSKILNLAALMLGFGLVLTQSAFTPGKDLSAEKRVKYTFHYTGPSAMTVGDVETESNWTYDPDGLECPSGTDQACSIRIEDTYVNNPGTPSATLKASANLTASSTAFGAVVTGSADGSITKLNREAE